MVIFLEVEERWRCKHCVYDVRCSQSGRNFLLDISKHLRLQHHNEQPPWDQEAARQLHGVTTFHTITHQQVIGQNLGVPF